MTPKEKMACRKLSTRPPFISDAMKCSTDCFALGSLAAFARLGLFGFEGFVHALPKMQALEVTTKPA